MVNELVLSISPGVDGLGRGFEQQGFCVVRGPDVLWGGDIHSFHPPAGAFDGVIGGDPCQAHSRLAHWNRALGREPRYPDMTGEFCRVVTEARPRWWLRENVPAAPDPVADGYIVTKLTLNNRWIGGEQSRLRVFWFGTRDGRSLKIVDLVVFENPVYEYAVIGGNGYCRPMIDRNNLPRTARSIARMSEAAKHSWARKCELQGWPPNYLADAPFTQAGKNRVLGNAVPLAMAVAIARAIRREMDVELINE